ncbi:MAG: YggS family pyridoxal phosphate enzyme [Bdellovibrionales bacterium RIFOXYD1_FULL_53_11]|nr:MAG: YggS family pyridoxal phosphate enzyme [Bdellovibrionales bacterium RIFOXYD1_FULL_53_11]
MNQIEPRYRTIIDRIKAAGGKQTVTLVAVSKLQSADAIEVLYRLGHRDFGENYVQELLSKAQELERRGCKDIRWHFIGHLQSNKARQLVPIAQSVHSVGSLKLASELSKRQLAAGRPNRLPVFIEVNIDREDSKAGATAEETPDLARKIAELDGIELRGLMCIPAFGSTGDGKAFAALKNLAASLHPLTAGDLSMGMTDDFEIAIREGATHVRIGTALFGARI